MNTCSFCQTSFISQRSLTAHQKTARYCLEKQGLSSAQQHVCEFCENQYSTVYRLRDHQQKCTEKQKFETENAKTKTNQHLIDMYELKLQVLEDKLHDKESEIQKLITQHEREVAKLSEQLERRIDDITDIARQTKTKTNHTNIQINNAAPLDLNDISHIHSILQEHMDINVLAAGQKGVARMLKEHYLTDENGLKRYRCTDANRGNFEYTDPNGHVERDPKCAKLREALVKSNIRDIAYERGDGWWKKEDGSTDMTKFEVMSGPVQEVALIANDDTKLRTELSVIMS